MQGTPEESWKMVLLLKFRPSFDLAIITGLFQGGKPCPSAKEAEASKQPMVMMLLIDHEWLFFYRYLFLFSNNDLRFILVYTDPPGNTNILFGIIFFGFVLKGSTGFSINDDSEWCVGVFGARIQQGRRP